MDTSLDDSFKEIKNQKWLPFIGQNYLSTPDNKKLLIELLTFKSKDPVNLLTPKDLILSK